MDSTTTERGLWCILFWSECFTTDGSNLPKNQRMLHWKIKEKKDKKNTKEEIYTIYTCVQVDEEEVFCGNNLFLTLLVHWFVASVSPSRGRTGLLVDVMCPLWPSGTSRGTTGCTVPGGCADRTRSCAVLCATRSPAFLSILVQLPYQRDLAPGP